VPFKSANILAVDAGDQRHRTGITKNKLIAMRELMAIRLVDLERSKCRRMVTAKQISATC
jgi:hypothetical protein